VQVDNAVITVGTCVVLHNICEATAQKSGHKQMVKISVPASHRLRDGAASSVRNAIMSHLRTH